MQRATQDEDSALSPLRRWRQRVARRRWRVTVALEACNLRTESSPRDDRNGGGFRRFQRRTHPETAKNRCMSCFPIVEVHMEGKDEQMAKTDMSVASAATLVAAQCLEATENMRADPDHLMYATSSAVNVRYHGDISTLTVAAATALSGVATLKARALKQMWNVAAAIPVPIEQGLSFGSNNSGSHFDELATEDNFLAVCNQEMLAGGGELLKRTRKGDLHWKIVSVYLHRTGNVMLKMKSKHAANTITKKKKNVVLDISTDVLAWRGRHLFEDGEQRNYFGLKTADRGVVEFECKSAKAYEMWTQGVSRLLSLVAGTKRMHLDLVV